MEKSTHSASDDELLALLSDLPFIGNTAGDEIESIRRVNEVYPFRISKHLLKQIAVSRSAALYSQFFPNVAELDDADGAGAFFADERQEGHTIVKKYPNRCIMYLTNNCFANCRHCSRKAKWAERSSFSRLAFDADCDSLTQRTDIEELVLTGGDPFTLGVGDLKYVLESVGKISNIQVVRLATRSFTSHPAAVTDEICEVLSEQKSLVIMTQFNHADEFSKETVAAIERVQRTGCPILNQAVLLKGVNDTPEQLKSLLLECAKNRVIPYYLFHAFKVKGTQCFRTDPLEGERLVNELVGNIGGWWIPKYTLIPKSTGVKVPAQPNGIICRDGGCLLVRDFRGRELPYD